MTVAQKADFTPSSRENEIETRIRALDELLLSTHTMASRGGAIGSKPNPEWREFVKKWKVFEGKREDTAEEAETQSGDWTRDDDETTASRKLYSTQKDKGRPKGYAKWNLQKKTKVVMAQVKEILDEYRAELPLTARQIFYRLVGAYGHPKTESFAESLTNWLVRARRSRKIPFKNIRDDGASVLEGKFYTGEEDFYSYIHDEAKGYERDKLANQRRDIRVYCEAAGMMPQLERVTRHYSVPVYSCSGFDSLTAKYDLAEAIAEAHTYRGRETVILHLGDMDPSGETIFDAISEDVYAFLEVDIPHKDPRDVAIFERVALTEEQVGKYDLPTDPAKESSHSAGWGNRRACQLEALRPDTLAEIVRAAIESHMDLSVLEADREAEVEERRKIAKALPAGAA
jgi:hypothetical protein